MNSTLENSTQGQWKTESAFFLISWQVFLIITGIPCNVLVARIAYQLVRQPRKRFEKVCRSSSSKMTQLFILNLSIIDILALILNAISRFAITAQQSVPCWTIVAASHWSTIASSLAVLCLNIDRYIAIVRPIHYPILVTKCRIYLSVVLCWTVASGWATFFIYRTYDGMSTADCALKPSKIGYYAAYTCTFFIVPNCISLILSIFVALTVLRRRRNRILTSSVKIPNQPCSIRIRSTNSGDLKSRKPRTTTKMLTFVFVATIWSCLTNLPYRLCALVGISLGSQLSELTYFVVLTDLLLALMYSNPAGNPFVTIFTQRRYRIMLREMWTRRKKTKENRDLRVYVYSVQNEAAAMTGRVSATWRASSKNAHPLWDRGNF